MVVDVSGYPGTSGTPVFDNDGLAVGLLAYRLEENSSAINHPAGKESYIVLPLEYASLQARSVINRFESRSGWLGISLSASGTAVRDSTTGSPAEKCGIRTGDKVVEFNGVAIANPGDLVRATGATRAGDTVKIKVMRNGEAVAVSARLMEFPQAAGR
jgi:S1-C subfamily serine protease